jgi:hypothetical protein
MKAFAYLSYALLTFPSLSTAHPGMGDTMASVRREANKLKRAESKLFIGDPRTPKDSQLTPIAKDTKAILLDQLDAESSVIDTSIPAGAIGSKACKADICCVWKRISYDMTAKSNSTSGRCTKLARQAVRLGFHDAAATAARTAPSSSPTRRRARTTAGSPPSPTRSKRGTPCTLPTAAAWPTSFRRGVGFGMQSL